MVDVHLTRWLMTADSIAPCLVRDVFLMTRSESKSLEHYYMGRVPCRTVRLVGIMVGPQVYENKIAYALSDGTGSIDCLVNVPRPQTSAGEIAPFPKPAVRIGDTVCVEGRVTDYHETRRILGAVIVKMAANDEMHHWDTVKQLHETYYYSPEPFQIPSTTSLVVPPTAVAQPSPCTPEGSSWTLQSSRPPNTHSAPTATIVLSQNIQNPRKLRHPSRLRSKDCTSANFQRYLHYIMTQLSPHSVYAFMKTFRGFSYRSLYRHSELKEFAGRVVDAEYRRSREKEKENCKSHKVVPPFASRKMGVNVLYVTTIRKLVHNGQIVLWSGPIHETLDTTNIWSISTRAMQMTDSSIRTQQIDIQDEEDVDVEAYAPVTPQYLSVEVERVMKRLSRRMYTREIILGYLRGDDMWKFVLAEDVQAALELLQSEGKMRYQATGSHGMWGAV